MPDNINGCRSLIIYLPTNSIAIENNLTYLCKLDIHGIANDFAISLLIASIGDKLIIPNSIIVSSICALWKYCYCRSVRTTTAYTDIYKDNKNDKDKVRQWIKHIRIKSSHHKLNYKPNKPGLRQL